MSHPGETTLGLHEKQVDERQPLCAGVTTLLGQGEINVTEGCAEGTII